MNGEEALSSKKPVAWVTLVLGLDLSYVAAASVLASSLKRLGTKGECVCMVTPDVPTSARTLLRHVFDRVEEFPYLETLALQKFSERFDGMYNYWLNKSFTKCAMFALVEYEKVIFLDADMLPLEYPDALFTCPSPAGICSSVKGAAENNRFHGMPLPQSLIDESLKNAQGHYGVRGCLLIMQPDLKVYHELKTRVENATSFGSLDSMVGPDEYMLTQYFSNQWHHVHAKYGWVSWAERSNLGVDPCFLHFVSQKPWEEGTAWDDFDYWKEEAVELLKQYPDAIIYFGHITAEMAEMAGVALTEELKAASKSLIEDAKQKKLKEKQRREEYARALGIDLTSSGSKADRWTKATSDFISPRSARPATHPRTEHALPISARSAESNLVVKKVATNVMIVEGFRRQEAKKKDKPKSSQKHKDYKHHRDHIDNHHRDQRDHHDYREIRDPDSAVKSIVPKLNLEGMHSEAGRKVSTVYRAQESKADGDWRTPSARLATPDRPSEELRPNSARHFPLTPTGSQTSGRRQPYTPHVKRCQTPKSSRADLASNWRSTPRTEEVHKHHPHGEPRSHRGTFGFQDRGSDRDSESRSCGRLSNEAPTQSHQF